MKIASEELPHGRNLDSKLDFNLSMGALSLCVYTAPFTKWAGGGPVTIDLSSSAFPWSHSTSNCVIFRLALQYRHIVIKLIQKLSRKREGNVCPTA